MHTHTEASQRTGLKKSRTRSSVRKNGNSKVRSLRRAAANSRATIDVILTCVCEAKFRMPNAVATTPKCRGPSSAVSDKR